MHGFNQAYKTIKLCVVDPTKTTFLFSPTHDHPSNKRADKQARPEKRLKYTKRKPISYVAIDTTDERD